MANKSINLTLKNVRIAFPALDAPVKFTGTPNSEAKYSVTSLIPLDHEAVAPLKKAISDVAKAAWGDEAKSTMELIVKSGKTLLKDGNDKANLAGYAGNLTIKAATKPPARPVVKDRDATDIPQNEIASRLYSGCFANVLISIYTVNSPSKQVCASLRGVQFVSAGEHFGGAIAPSDDEFEALAPVDIDDPDSGFDDLV